MDEKTLVALEAAMQFFEEHNLSHCSFTIATVRGLIAAAREGKGTRPRTALARIRDMDPKHVLGPFKACQAIARQALDVVDNVDQSPGGLGSCEDGGRGMDTGGIQETGEKL